MERFWIDEEVGFPCLILTGPLGAINGYVAVSTDHPWYGLGYDECRLGCEAEAGWCAHTPEARIDVHGGLTYAGRGIEKAIDPSIKTLLPLECHWFRFDTAHVDDIVPGLHQFPGSTVKDEAFVAHECHRLAVQLSALIK